MKAVLTDKLLRAIAGKGAPHEPIWDQHIRGLVARIGDRGGISFSAVGRQRGGGRVPIRLSIGRYPIVSLAEARERAKSLLRELYDGIDPRARRAAQQQAEAGKREEETAKRASFFSVVAEDFIRRHLAGKRTARAIELRIRRELLLRWRDQPISEIKRPDVVGMIDAIVDRGHPEAARQSFVYARRLFHWAVTRGLLEHAPTDHLNVADLIGAKKPRQRLLTDDELALVWRASETTTYPDGPYMMLLLLLGARRSELGNAVWAEFDLDKALWTIPPQRMKSDEGFVVPLPPKAVEILRALPRFASGYVFTARGNRPLNDFGAVKQRLDRCIAVLNDGRPMAAWTFHDARRTFRTGLSTLGVAPHIAELCLAHRQPGLARVYDLHKFEAEKRHALRAWTTRLLSIVELPPDKIVSLRSLSA
jgi:integrase